LIRPSYKTWQRAAGSPSATLPEPVPLQRSPSSKYATRRSIYGYSSSIDHSDEVNQFVSRLIILIEDERAGKALPVKTQGHLFADVGHAPTRLLFWSQLIGKWLSLYREVPTFFHTPRQKTLRGGST